MAFNKKYAGLPDLVSGSKAFFPFLKAWFYPTLTFLFASALDQDPAPDIYETPELTDDSTLPVNTSFQFQSQLLKCSRLASEAWSII